MAARLVGLCLCRFRFEEVDGAAGSAGRCSASAGVGGGAGSAGRGLNRSTSIGELWEDLPSGSPRWARSAARSRQYADMLTADPM